MKKKKQFSGSVRDFQGFFRMLPHFQKLKKITLPYVVKSFAYLTEWYH